MAVRLIPTTRAVGPARGQHADLAEALARHGAEAGHYSVLGPDDWRVLWNAERTGFVAFFETSQVVLSWRSPVADVAEQPALLGDLLAYARDSRRQLFAMPVNATMRDTATALGLHVAWVGTECYVRLPAWSLDGGRRQKVRWARSHALKLGLTWREAHPLTSAVDRAALASVEARWKAERSERSTDSFLRNSFAELAHWRRYFVAEDTDGVVASVTCTPINDRSWYLQDLVRAPDAARGALEGALVLALDTLRDEGYAYADNGPLTFWRPGGAEDPQHSMGPFGNQVLRYFDHRYRFHGINQFRAKLEPDHTAPLYVIRSHRLITPGVARGLTRLLTRGSDA